MKKRYTENARVRNISEIFKSDYLSCFLSFALAMSLNTKCFLYPSSSIRLTRIKTRNYLYVTFAIIQRIDHATLEILDALRDSPIRPYEPIRTRGQLESIRRR